MNIKFSASKLSDSWGGDLFLDLRGERGKKKSEIMESRPLKNITQENANKLEKGKRACITSHRPVNPTVNHVIPHIYISKYIGLQL